MADAAIQVTYGHQLPAGTQSPDVYFTPGYGRAAGVADGGEWVLLTAFDGAWQVPLIVRTLLDRTKDAVSPYGYSGVYASPSLSPSQIQEAWAGTFRCLRDLGIISVLLRHSPLVPQAPDLPGLRSIVSAHPTILLEPADTDSAWSGLKQTCRTAVRKAIKNGYTGGVRRATSADLARDGDFRRLYEQTMERVEAAPLYFFGDEYYKELLDGLGSSLLIAEVRDQSGAVASSSLLMRHALRLHGHLAGSNRDDARLGSNNLLDWTVVEFAIEQGIREYHLGGGLDPYDSLYKFKRSFGGRELLYSISGVIIDDELYHEHVRGRAKECDTTTDALLTSSYFPAYRRGTE